MATKKGAAGQAPRAPSRRGPTSRSEAWNDWIADEASIDALCERIISGDSLNSVAKSLGIGLSTLTDWIAANPERSARAREARIASATACDDQAFDLVMAAGDPFALAKAKEAAHHLRWRAKTRDPRTYGDKIDLTGEVSVRDLPDDILLAKAAKLTALLQQAKAGDGGE
jgi:hypothetical protein